MKHVDICWELFLLFFISFSAFLILFSIPKEEPEIIEQGFTPLDMAVNLPELPNLEDEPFMPDVIRQNKEIRRRIGEITFQRTRLILGESYRMFITSYCSAECGGSTTTSSGAQVHRASHSNRYFEPTTCAIDRRYFDYGDLFYIPSEDRVYVAEDTGSGVKGMWLDTFQTSMSDVRGYNTRYETVNTCKFEDYEVMASSYDVFVIVNINFLSKNGGAYLWTNS